MRKTLLIFLLLLSTLSFGQIASDKLQTIPKSKIDPATTAQWDAAGSGNPNVIIPSSLTDITNAGAGAYIVIQDTLTMTANYQIPSGQTWDITTGLVDADTYELDFNNVIIKFNGKRKGLDLSSATVTGVAGLNDRILNAENIGLVDDDAFDNFQGIKNALHIVNQNSGHLYFNKQTGTGIYYFQVYNDDYGSPFFTNGYGSSQVLIVGNGYDNVQISSQTSVKLRTYASNEDGSAAFVLYNTKNTEIFNNHFIGDRYTHYYDQEITIDAEATSAGNVRLRIIEHPDFQDNITKKEINEVIALTNSNLATNLQEVIDYVNTDPDFSDWTASALDANTIRLRGTAGQYSSTFFTDEGSGATVSAASKLYEWGHCIVQGSMTINPHIHHNTIVDYHGDAIAKSEQGNGTTSLDFEDFTNGDIDENGTITNGDNGYWYLTVTRNMPTPHGWFTLTNNSYQALKLLHFKYWMVYYDDTDTFIAKSPTLTPFDIYEYPGEFKKYRIIIEDYGTDMSTLFTYFINSPSEPKGGIIEHNIFKDNRRHAITNVLPNQIVQYNEFYRNSGVAPEIDLNIEDWGKKVQNQVVRHNRFTVTNIANISIKGCNRVQIYGNKFEQGSYQLNTGGYDALPPAILVSFARNTQIWGNYFVNRSGYVDILTNSHNNHYTNSRIGIRSGNATMHHETFVNSTIGDGTVGGIDTENGGGIGMSHLEDSKFYFNDGWGNYRLVDEANTIHHKNVRYYFNETAKGLNHSTLVDSDLRDVYWRDTSYNYLGADRTTSNNGEHEGSYDGVYVYGAKVEPTLLHKVGWAQYAAPTKNIYLSSSLKIDHGYEKSFTFDTGEVNGWFWLELGEYPTNGGGNYETIYIENVDFTLPANIDANEGYLNNSQYGGTQLNNFIRVTQDVNVNLVFKDCKFISNDTTDNLFMYLGNRGTTDFIDCTFDAPQAENIDFTNTGSEKTSGVYAGANHGAITITNATTPGNRITFTGATVN